MVARLAVVLVSVVPGGAAFGVDMWWTGLEQWPTKVEVFIDFDPALSTAEDQSMILTRAEGERIFYGVSKGINNYRLEEIGPSDWRLLRSGGSVYQAQWLVPRAFDGEWTDYYNWGGIGTGGTQVGATRVRVVDRGSGRLDQWWVPIIYGMGFGWVLDCVGGLVCVTGREVLGQIGRLHLP